MMGVARDAAGTGRSMALRYVHVGLQFQLIRLDGRGIARLQIFGQLPVIGTRLAARRPTGTTGARATRAGIRIRISVV